jgi:malonate decarboxylase gamma subunit
MTLDEVITALLPGTAAPRPDEHGVVSAQARTAGGKPVGLTGLVGGAPLGVDAALAMAGHVLAHGDAGDGVPLLVLVDAQSQLMTRRDELLGLNEFLAHLAKSLTLLSLRKHRTVGLLYGKAAAGAFIATALATDTLVALEGAAPSVMDLPSIARITKLPAEQLEEMSRTTPIFAPGLEPLAATGAVAERWDDRATYAAKLDALLDAPFDGRDRRDELGAERKGRLVAAAVARRVQDAVRAG